MRFRSTETTETTDQNEFLHFSNLRQYASFQFHSRADNYYLEGLATESEVENTIKHYEEFD